jgi:sugar lactone lactonase YvrE
MARTRTITRILGAAAVAAPLLAGAAGLHAAAPVQAAGNVHAVAATTPLKSAIHPNARIELSQTPAVTGTVASTVPGNGDVNPYGVALVPRTMGTLLRGHLLISNFNSQDAAGRGDTIVQIGPDDGTQRLFTQLNPGQLAGSCTGVGAGGVGLTTALTVLKRGYVIVGSLPTKDGKPETAAAGCLIVLDTMGHVVRTITAPDISGPWDMTALDQGATATLFVTNALNGSKAALKKGTSQGTVVRLQLSVPNPGQGVPRVLTNTVIASGFAERTDPAALVLGPTGVGLGRDGTLYVADTLENRIAAIPDALTRSDDAYTGRDLTEGGDLNGPLGLIIAPNGDILTANGNDGKLVRTTPDGTQSKAVLIDGTPSQGNPPGAGALFGLTVSLGGHQIYFGDDATNSLNRVTVAQTM